MEKQILERTNDAYFPSQLLLVIDTNNYAVTTPFSEPRHVTHTPSDRGKALKYGIFPNRKYLQRAQSATKEARKHSGNMASV
jgi:hypothetical protein